MLRGVKGLKRLDLRRTGAERERDDAAGRNVGAGELLGDKFNIRRVDADAGGLELLRLVADAADVLQTGLRLQIGVVDILGHIRRRKAIGHRLRRAGRLCDLLRDFFDQFLDIHERIVPFFSVLLKVYHIPRKLSIGRRIKRHRSRILCAEERMGFPMNITVLTEENYAAEVERADRPVLIDFYAAWCGPCKALAPTVEALAAQYGGTCKFCKIDVDAEPLLAQRFRIMSVPTLVLLNGGRVETQLSGVRSAEEIVRHFGLNA